jgi:hypothetical protein
MCQRVPGSGSHVSSGGGSGGSRPRAPAASSWDLDLPLSSSSCTLAIASGDDGVPAARGVPTTRGGRGAASRPALNTPRVSVAVKHPELRHRHAARTSVLLKCRRGGWCLRVEGRDDVPSAACQRRVHFKATTETGTLPCWKLVHRRHEPHPAETSSTQGAASAIRPGPIPLQLPAGRSAARSCGQRGPY